jgi:S1-C subfamily serine protease
MAGRGPAGRESSLARGVLLGIAATVALTVAGYLAWERLTPAAIPPSETSARDGGAAPAPAPGPGGTATATATETETQTGTQTGTAAARSDGALEDVIGRAIESVVSIISDEGRGSGFLVDPQTVVTNYHVVGANRTVLVKLSNGHALSGTVLRVSQEHDLALVKLDRALTDRASLSLSSVQTLRVGQDVYVIGSPMGVLESSVTRGIVSQIRSYEGSTLVQTDAAINPGNSGGPLLDRGGRVIGIATMKVAEGESIGFAVAADHARELLEGGGELASERTGVPTRGLAASYGESEAPASKDEAKLARILEDARPQFLSLAQAVSRCPELARDFERKDEDQALFRLGEIVLEYVDQRKIYAANQRNIPSWNRFSCLGAAEGTIVSCYRSVALYDEAYKSYTSEAARRGERPRMTRKLPRI